MEVLLTSAAAIDSGSLYSGSDSLGTDKTITICS
jgi:hypothetical protein